jgi:hypothetical protein
MRFQPVLVVEQEKNDADISEFKKASEFCQNADENSETPV